MSAKTGFLGSSLSVFHMLNFLGQNQFSKPARQVKQGNCFILKGLHGNKKPAIRRVLKVQNKFKS